MKLNFNKKKTIFSSILFVCILGLLIGFRDIFYIDDSFAIIPFMGSIILNLILAFLLCFDFTIEPQYKKRFNIVNVLFSLFFIVFIVELLNENNLFTVEFSRLALNFLLVSALYLLLFAIINNLKVSVLLSNIFLFALGFTNYSITSLRRTPLSLLDVLSVGTGLTIASTYTLIVSFYLVLALLSFAILLRVNFSLDYKLKVSKKSIICRLLSVAVVIVFMFLIFFTDFIDIFNLDTNLWVPSEEYHRNGFLSSFVKQAKELMIEKPSNYSSSAVKDIYYAGLETIPVSSVISGASESESKLDSKKPNIIVIMSESFADLSVHRSFNTNVDYIPYFKSVCENTISGYAHSSVFGGKTPNSEWEFLTNNSMAFFSYGSVPYQQFIRRNSYSLATTLKAQGYSTSALHPWYRTGYRRSSVYPLIGFEKFLSLEDIESDIEYIRDFPSDLSTYKQLIKMFEEKDSDKPFFNFTVTMQNHSGYDYSQDDFTANVNLTDISGCPKVEQYLSVVNKSDEALKYLIDYFSNINEDTIILFFGDHQPPYLEDEFWDYLDQDKSDDSLSDYEKDYLTPYFIWANYELPDYDVPDISLNYLSILLLDVAGLKTTPYQNFLRDLQKDIPVITGHGYMDKTGVYHNLDEENEYSTEIRNYEILQYNNMFDRKNVFTEMFKISN